ncbi:hypothetical protein FRC14_006665 [Serendipita sp. 396]|nr:hypothetical protein FRC14_006665 [Serendipita sp. 396]KAG8778661.1 hypothetical protein FRC15_010643 [Serendipita sp. 397]KAG8795694.1 hypothetical protein FRC16_009998 [Serendipita sp. 398]KAG8821097.1 hypothetical protein FRC18_011446 [Serendipita sp. 400]KAG8823408.1 hypothetical protein FRC19_003989 [Serendipita sp. 401]KAG8847335.1 hypothetical protein FRB91_011891 [Serendipita sp. 411]KAG8863939.1 hypothetical protein FRC20_010423 [Serendipita sp. 405]KAG9052450.1 hypothetical prot
MEGQEIFLLLQPILSFISFFRPGAPLGFRLTQETKLVVSSYIPTMHFAKVLVFPVVLALTVSAAPVPAPNAPGTGVSNIMFKRDVNMVSLYTRNPQGGNPGEHHHHHHTHDQQQGYASTLSHSFAHAVHYITGGRYGHSASSHNIDTSAVPTSTESMDPTAAGAAAAGGSSDQATQDPNALPTS